MRYSQCPSSLLLFPFINDHRVSRPIQLFLDTEIRTTTVRIILYYIAIAWASGVDKNGSHDQSDQAVKLFQAPRKISLYLP